MKRLFLSLLFFLSMTISAQQSNTLFLLHDVPQSNLLNPAVQLTCKWFVGIPILGTTHINYSNSAFTFNDLVNGDQLDFNSVYNKLDRMNMISVDVATYPVLIGFRSGFDYFTFSVSDRFSSYNSFSKKLAGIVLYGNSQFIGDNIRLNNTRVNALYYREYSAGWSVVWDRFTTFGFKAKLLFGKAGIYTGVSRVRLGTAEDTYDLTLKGKLSFNTSFPLTVSQNSAGIINDLDVPELDYLRMFLNPRNPGLAMDFGIINTFSKDLTLSASILDLGMIIWTDELNNIKGDVDFIYRGVQEGIDFSAEAYFQELSDSIRNDILYEVSQNPYISPLPLQIILGAEYKWKKSITLGLVSRNFFVNRRISPSLTAAVNTELLNDVLISLSWSYLDNSIANIGTGVAYTGRGIQFYVISDNVLGLIRPLDTHNLNFRFGMNLMLGCPRDLKDIRNDRKYMPLGKCEWIERERNRKRN